jgi:hypothetical protein
MKFSDNAKIGKSEFSLHMHFNIDFLVTQNVKYIVCQLDALEFSPSIFS